MGDFDVRKMLGRIRHHLLTGVRLPAALGLLATVFVAWLQISPPPGIRALVERLDNIVYDLRLDFLLPGDAGNPHKIVIVDYDQKSLAAEGQWPWSRFKLGDMVAALGEAGAVVVGFDVFFPEPERDLIQEMADRLDPEIVDAIPNLSVIEQALDADAYFADKLRDHDVALGFSFRQQGIEYGKLPRPIVKMDKPGRLSLLQAQGYEGNIPALLDAAAGAGFIDTVPDADGVIRRTPLVIQYGDALYPSLALEMARLYYFEEDFRLETQTGPFGEEIIVGIRMGGILIPTDTAGRVLVPYAGVSRLGQISPFPYISATDVLRGTLTGEERQALQNALVLIGTTATGLYDLRPTPLEAVYPGVEVQANVLNALLDASPTATIGDTADMGAVGLNLVQDNPFPYSPDWEEGAMLLTIVVAGVLLSLLLPHLGPTLLALAGLTFTMAFVMVNFMLWAYYRLDMSLVILLLLVLLITVINMTWGFLREGLNRRAITGMFGQYVPPAHIDRMLNDPEHYSSNGESKDLTVLFADIRGFTSLAESLSASELKTILNDYFTPITEIIFEHQGTIDKYVGDMVMAFWGAPLDDPEHRAHAVRTAMQMLDKVEDLKASFRARDLPDLSIGVGVNSGPMHVGDMGSSFRRAYTVLGDAVNLGSRLESLTKFYGVNVLIGEDTFEGLDSFLCRLVDKVRVKGKEAPVRIYEPLCPQSEASPQLKARLAEYEQALTAYFHRDWDAASAGFQRLADQEPDTALYGVYLERVALMRATPPEKDWDGAYRHLAK